MEEIYKNLEWEEWLPIEGYYGMYEVSNYGRIKSIKYDKEKILKQVKLKNGYLKVTLCKEDKMETCYVHRLVANAFIENPNNYPCVNHIDENPLNNCSENLEWCTYQYNSNYGTCQQRKVEKQSRQVYQYTKDGKLVSIWTSVNECGRNGFNKGHVAACCRGEEKSHKGYIWSYREL